MTKLKVLELFGGIGACSKALERLGIDYEIADKLSKKINQYDLDNNFIKTWNSSMEIERTIGIDQSNVCLCCNGKRDTVGGFKWKYLDLDYLKSKGE